MTYGNYPDLSLVKKILVIRLRHHGDVLLSSPVFSVLKQRLPAAQIDAYVYEDTGPMLQGHPAIDQMFYTQRKKKGESFFSRLFKDVSLFLRLRKNGYDLVINLTEGDRGAIVAALCGSRYKVGFARKGKNRVYTHVIKHCSLPRHTVEKQLDALRCIGIFPAKEQRELSLCIPDSARQAMQALIGIDKPFMVLHPVSRWRFKCPPVETIASVADHFSHLGWHVVITGADTEIEKNIATQIVALCTGKTVRSICGMVSLKEMAALLKSCTLLLTVDSLPLHIASALKTPVVALFGPTSEKNWGPWMHPCAKVLYEDMPCRPCHLDGCAGSKMSDCLFTLSSTRIIEAMDQLIKKNPLHILTPYP